jgi:hypothetical protein
VSIYAAIDCEPIEVALVALLKAKLPNNMFQTIGRQHVPAADLSAAQQPALFSIIVEESKTSAPRGLTGKLILHGVFIVYFQRSGASEIPRPRNFAWRDAAQCAEESCRRCYRSIRGDRSSNPWRIGFALLDRRRHQAGPRHLGCARHADSSASHSRSMMEKKMKLVTDTTPTEKGTYSVLGETIAACSPCCGNTGVYGKNEATVCRVCGKEFSTSAAPVEVKAAPARETRRVREEDQSA